MSFGSEVRFEPDKTNRPVLFWELPKTKKNHRKFSYKHRDQRYPVRHSHFEDHCEECRHKTLHKHDRRLPPSANFIKKNITNVRNKCPPGRRDRLHEKSFVNNVINRCSPRRRCADTITLTDTQLNALLEAVRNMSSESQNTIKFRLDGKVNEIQVNSGDEEASPSENPKDQFRDLPGKLDAEHKPDSEETIQVVAPVAPRELERPRGVDRSGMFDGGSLSPIMDELESESEDEKCSEDSVHPDERSKSSAPDLKHVAKMATIPSATVSGSIWSDPGSSVDLPPLVPRAHLTLAEKKKPQWARERAEFDSCYDPWRHRRVTKSTRSVSRAGSILTDYPSIKFSDLSVNRLHDAIKCRHANGQHANGQQNNPKILHSANIGENAYKSPKEDVYCIDLKPLQVMEDEKKVLQKIQERTKWLMELEKQREEQRLQRFERQQADQEAFNNSFMEHFSRDRRPAPLPSQVNIQKDRSMVTMMPSRFY